MYRWREPPQEQSKLHIWAVCRSRDVLLSEKFGAFFSETMGKTHVHILLERGANP